MRLALLVLVFLAGCASIESVDRSRLNHPAMSLESRRTPALKAPLTGLGDLASSQIGGTCSACAKP